MKKVWLGMVALLVAASMAGCGGETKPAEPDTTQTEGTTPEETTPEETTEEDTTGDAAPAETEYQYVSGADAVAAVGNADVQIVDARDPESYKAGTLEGAINVDFSKPDDEAYKTAFIENSSQIAKDKKVYFICFSGNKVAKAAIDTLVEQGYDPANLYIIEEGAKGADLQAAFKPVE